MSKPTVTYDQKLEIKKEGESNIVKYHQAKKICELQTDVEIANFQLKLNAISQSLGITNVPDDKYLDSVFVFLQRNFGKDITTLEVSYAFELYIMDKLEVKKQHWSTFNFEFIAAVLNGYKKYRQPVLAEHNKEQLLLENPPVQVTYQEHCEKMHNVIMHFIEEGMPMRKIFGDWEAAYDHLVATGKIVMTNEQKQSYKDNFKKTRLDELQKQASMFSIDRIRYAEETRDLNDDQKLQWLCRRDRKSVV